MKRYLGVPNHCRNSIVHHITETKPLFLTLKDTALKNLESLSFPEELSGHKLSFVNDIHQFETNYSPLKEIPSYYWRSRVIQNLPINPKMRKSICSEVFDLDHLTYCINKTFHSEFKEGCLCVVCLKPICAYHKYTCRTQQLKIVLTPLKSPDKWYKKYSDMSKHTKEIISIDEKATTLNFLKIQRKSIRNIKINSKFAGDDWINNWYFYIHCMQLYDIICIA